MIRFSCVEGDYIYQKNPVFYIRKDLKQYADYILSNFKIEKDEKHLNEDVKNIIKEVIERIKNTSYYNSISKEVKEFYEEIISNDLVYIEEILYDDIFKLTSELVKLKDFERLDNLYKVIEDFCFLACKRNKIQYFEKYYELLFRICYYKIEEQEEIDVREIAFEYTKKVNTYI